MSRLLAWIPPVAAVAFLAWLAWGHNRNPDCVERTECSTQGICGRICD